MIDLKVVTVTNFLGLLTLLTVAGGNSWRINDTSKESKYLKILIFSSVLSCIMETLSYWTDGKPGALLGFIRYFSSAWTYAMNMVVSPSWLLFLSYHINGRLDKIQKIFLIVFEFLGIGFLILNLFIPGLVFYIDENNTYSRGTLYPFYLAIEAFFLIDSVYLYIKAKKKGGVLKFFPVWVFLIPIALGIIIQSSFYGISVIWACLAISVSGILASLQNEIIFQDKLTGIYNRFYLDNIKENLKKSENAKFTAIMLDLNNFKSINDKFGHNTGDEALINAASMMKEAVGERGSVIRYAGDEFVVILNTSDNSDAIKCIEEINRRFKEFNDRPDSKYILSASSGYETVDLRTKTVDDLLNDIDFKMYENKKEYYRKNKK